ncbi:histidinol phosphate phosphatase [Heliophilum fasciatum]|uniref:Histidinol-phosphatase n=1 Tax=Heliophilum fasciatum TaxID=35700 RepID=A0A4R2RRQ5_9FIRM|nr:histidinol phosphate phosphatase [Heliophilum fasciatum]MCW2277542.1 histidinol-phosphatase (PHP family) [Heliophilum fasciatum]TCP65167.1 histidinol-phosphatase (PHP family) [Heliophilum fasciatum]
MLFDTHIHTRYSTDSRMTIEEASAQARAQQIGLILTEHLDLKFPEADAFLLDVDSYFTDYLPWRSDTLLLGVEVGLREDVDVENRECVERYPFDYVIGSIHVVDNIDLYTEGYYRGRSKEEAYGAYFNAMIACLRASDYIDSLGHIDYIARYARVDNPEIEYEAFREQIDGVLRLLIERNIILELNTRRLERKAAIDALRPILQRYRELGGRCVTIGSDAHVPAAIGSQMATAVALADACQLRPVYFKQRRMEYCT